MKPSIEAICRWYGISRQAHYQKCMAEQQESEREQQILRLIRAERRLMPRLGVRKLHSRIADRLGELGISYGRDKLFALLAREGLLLRPRRVVARTTDSSHGFRRYGNLVVERVIDAAHQVMVADITYLRVAGEFRYLSLIMDSYSRKIIGYDLSASLSIEGSHRALKMALRQLPADRDWEVIHHSDQGVQYCSGPYIKTVTGAGVRVSMAGVGNPYENAQAERLNGILKHEFLLNQHFASESEARRAVRQAVRTYNEERPHLALNFQTPEQVHQQFNGHSSMKKAA